MWSRWFRKKRKEETEYVNREVEEDIDVGQRQEFLDILLFFLYKTKELKKNINYFSRKKIVNVRDKKEE